MTKMSRAITFERLSRSDLASALRGERHEVGATFNGGPLPRLNPKDALVFWKGQSRRPAIIGIADEDQEELFAWAFSFHRDLTPLTSWCNVVPLKELLRFADGEPSTADLSGLEAAWASAIVAEAMVLSRRGYESITLASCLATDTYGVARTASLYGAKSALTDTIEKSEQLRSALRTGADRWRASSGTALGVLIRLMPNASHPISRVQDLLLRACRQLKNHGSTSDDSAFEEGIAAELSLGIRGLSNLAGIMGLPAEKRVELLRQIPVWATDAKDDDERSILFFVAGYLISGVGGAERDLRLAELFNSNYPHVLTWAAVLGSIGSQISWTDAFGGIGRLVVRELMRPFDPFDSPTADIAADELFTTSSKGQLRFRTASRNVISVSLRPGVVVQSSVSEEDRPTRVEGPRSLGVGPGAGTDQELRALADRLFPHLRQLLTKAGYEPSTARRTSKKGKTPQLPLK